MSILYDGHNILFVGYVYFEFLHTSMNTLRVTLCKLNVAKTI